VGDNVGEFNAELRSRGEISSLINQINGLQARLNEYDTALSATTKNRDDAHKCAWALHYELEDAKKGIAILLKALDEAYEMCDEQRANSREALERRQGLLDNETATRERYQRVLKAVTATSQMLIAAAETGHANTQEYRHAKAIYQEFLNLWSRCYSDPREDYPDFS
jgi:thiaminase